MRDEGGDRSQPLRVSVVDRRGVHPLHRRMHAALDRYDPHVGVDRRSSQARGNRCCRIDDRSIDVGVDRRSIRHDDSGADAR